MHNSLRGPLCALLLLIFDLYATHMLGDSVCSVSREQPEYLLEARELLDDWSKVYPDSAIFLLLSGRLQELSGNLNAAIELFQKSIDSQSDWIHYHHVCYWELIWCYALQADWLGAIKYTDKLAIESRWSQASYRYMKAAFLLQHMEDRASITPKPGDTSSTFDQFSDFKGKTKVQSLVDQLLSDIPKLTKRFGGRSLPIEKIALRKSSRYFAQNKRLTLPALELIFIWNGFKMIQSQPDAITAFILICENKINELLNFKGKVNSTENQSADSNENFYDDYCLALMLKGVCLRCRGQAFQATMCFKEILESKRKLKLDTYLLPYCEMELCQISFEENDYVEAAKHLEKALSYKGYHLESRLHFRIHEMDTKLRQVKKIKKSGSANNMLESSTKLSSAVSSASVKSFEGGLQNTTDSDRDSNCAKELFDDENDFDLDDELDFGSEILKD